jgi:hypothetical protein
MKKLILAGMLALALPLLAVPSRAQAWVFYGCYHPYINMCCKTCPPPAQCGPWYLYWPMEAHFQVPAPTGYPYWPSPMTLPGLAPAGAPVYGGPGQGPALTPASYCPPGYGYGY